MSQIEDVVRASSRAGMPMNKFKGILDSILPSIDGFTNKLDDLTGVVKMLGRSMSPETIKKFLSAFTNMFSGTDFRKRLKATLVVGTGRMAEKLTTGFSKSIESFAGGKDTELYKALQSGDRKAFNVALMKKQAESGGQITGSAVEEAMSKFQGYQLAKSGKALSVASALASGTDMQTNLDIMRETVGRFNKKGEMEGINEYIAEQMGYSQEQIQLLRRYDNSINNLTDNVQSTGMTGYESVNKALAKQAESELKKEGKEVTPEAVIEKIKTFSKDQVKEAAKSSKEFGDIFSTAESRQKEIVGLTTSISDKIDKTIGFLLEKIFNLMSGLLSKLDGVFSWLTSDTAGKQNALAKQSLISGDTSGDSARAEKRAEAITNIMTSNKSTQDMANEISKKFDFSKIKPEDLANADAAQLYAKAKASGVSVADINGINLSEGQEISAVQSVIDTIKQGGNVSAALRTASGSNAAGMSALIATLGPLLGKAGFVQEQSTQMRADDGVSSALDTERNYSRGAEAVYGAYLQSGASGANMPMPEGPPAAGSSPPAVVRNQAEAVQSTSESSEVVASNSTKSAKSDAVVAKAVTNGLKLDSNYTGGEFKQTMTEAVKNGVEPPLIQHAMMLMKASADPEWASALLAGGADKSMGFDVMNVTKEGMSQYLSNLPAFADGGPVGSDMVARIHAGEYVVPKGGALISNGSGSGVNIGNISISVNVDGSSSSGEEIAAQIQEALYDTFSGMVTA
jgi:hypothetical protein